METKIEKIKGEDHLVVKYKEQVFQVKYHTNDVKYFKHSIDIMINRFAKDVRNGEPYPSENSGLAIDSVSHSILEMAKWLLKHKRSVFIEMDVSKEDKVAILNKLNYSENILD